MASTTIHALLAAAPGFIRRQAKSVRQLPRALVHSRRVGFVFGCQRSGTKMVMRILDEAPDTRIFHENHSIAFRDFQLRSDATIRTVIGLTPAPVQVFKPICDSHTAADILARFPQSRGAWIVRAAADVANSAVDKWGDHQACVIRALLDGDTTTWGWRTAGVTARSLEQLRSVCGDTPLTPHEGAMLFWWVRNQSYFDQGLHESPRMRLVRYADLVTDPVQHFPALFDHMGAAWDPAFVDRVRATSVGRAAPPAVRPGIDRLCRALAQRFDATAPTPLPLPPRLMLFIDTLGLGGAERYVVTVANRWVEQGVEVTVVSEGGEQINRLDPRIEHVDGPYDEVRATLPTAAMKLRGVIQRTRPDCIITNSLATALVARATLATRQIPIVNVGHGWPAERYARVARPMALVDRVVAVSPDVRNRLVDAGLSPSQIVVVHNGIDCRPFVPPEPTIRTQIRAELGATEPNHILVVTVGRLESQKAHQHIVEMAVQLRDSHPHLRFALVGTGSREAELHALVQTLGVSDRVHLAGKRTDIPDILGAADIYLNCSDWEGMPLSTIEGMAAGLAAVVTRTEGAAQLFTPETGLVVPVGDVPALSDAVATLADDADRREAMGRAARTRARSHFSHTRMVDQLMAVVQTVTRPSLADSAP